MSSTGELLSIGEFARRSGISIKALRRYADQGVFLPARVDRSTGYRMYGTCQLREAKLVRLLRTMDMPLSTVTRILSSDQDRTDSMVADHWEDLEERMRRYREAMVQIVGGSDMSRSVGTGALSAWQLSGTDPEGYECALVAGDRPGERRVVRLRCVGAAPEGFGTIMQMIKADRYRGQRVRFSGTLRGQDVFWGALWLRIDGHLGQLAIDNMQDRPVQGTTDWHRYSVVLDVTHAAAAIGFGVLLGGGGELRAYDLAFEVVGHDVDVTNAGNLVLPEEPQNLDFEG